MHLYLPIIHTTTILHHIKVFDKISKYKIRILRNPHLCKCFCDPELTPERKSL